MLCCVVLLCVCVCVLADDLECFAQAVVEAILRKVVALEAAAEAASAAVSGSGAEDSSCAPSGDHKCMSVSVSELTADTGMDVAARCLLLALKGTASEAQFKKSLKLLLKTLRALTSAPNALSSRRLRKTTPAVAQCVLEHSELLDLTSRLGFTDEGACLSLLKLDPDLVSQALLVVEEFAAEVNLAA